MDGDGDGDNQKALDRQGNGAKVRQTDGRVNKRESQQQRLSERDRDRAGEL